MRHSAGHPGGGVRHVLFPLAAAALVALAGALAPTAIGANYSYPATYSGSAAGGGTVEFDVAADGSAVTRFAASEVETSCGTVSATASGSFAISNDAFSNGSPTATGLRFNGSFPADRQARGTLSFRLVGFPSCTSADVSWAASTSVAPPASPVAAALQTKISSGPKGRVATRKATFRFHSSESGSTFQCRLDRKAWQPCRSPKSYRGLKEGKHTFRVRARNGAGAVDPTPAKRSWRVEAHG